MSGFPRFDASAALNAIQERTPAKVANPAKEASETANFSGFSDFSGPFPARDDSTDDRRAWADELASDLSRWLSVHPPDVWRAARIGERIADPYRQFEALLAEYVSSGERSDRRAAVFAAEAVAATAAKATREWRSR